jgi:hypothetical protein
MASGGSGSGNVDIQVNFFGTDNVTRQMNVIGRASEQFGSAMTSKLGKMFGAVAIGTMAFSKLEQAISKNMATAKQVSSLAIKFNVDPSAVHSMKIAADDAGVSIRSLMMASKQFGKVAGEALSSKTAAENMKQLGISAEKLADMQMKPMKYLPDAAVALATIADENERAAAGAFLFGRQYQQISPLLEKLGADEQARGEFLSNNNAMTNEQIALNKEAARIQSQMSEGWDRFVASGTPALNWAMNFASYMANALASMLGIIANQDKIRTAEEKQQEGKDLYNLSNFTGGLAMRTKIVGDKLAAAKAAAGGELTGEGTTAEQIGVSEEQWKEYEAVQKAGSAEEYVNRQISIIRKKREMGAYLQNSAAGVDSDNGVESGPADPNAKMPTELPEEITGGKHIFDVQEDANISKLVRNKVDGSINFQTATLDEMQEKLAMAAAATEMHEGIISNPALTEGEDGLAYASPLAGLAKELTEGGQKDEASAREFSERAALAARQAFARLKGREYDSVTGQEMNKEDYDALMRSRGEAKDGNANTFNEAKAAEAARKEKKKATRAFEKSERKLNEENLTPVQKAEAGLEDVRGDMVPIQEDIADKLVEEEKAKERIKKHEEELLALTEKQNKGKEMAEQLIAKTNEKLAADGKKLSLKQIEDIKLKFGLTKDELDKVSQLNGAIRGDQKALTKSENERIVLQTQLNGEKAKEKAAIEAIKKAKESEWAKEKAAAKDLADDKKAYEREMQGLKYKNMKLEGATQLDIMKEKYNDELAHYTEAAEEKEALEKEIADKQAARVEAAFQAGEANPYEAGKATDEETAQIKAAREKQDAGRKGLEDALYAMDSIKPHAVVSELGKMGGGAAVQFGNNPVDEIRKSNSFLKAIEKNTSSSNIKKVEKFETKAEREYRDMEAGLFGEDVPM